ncbi:D-galactarate dehydratase, partial [Yoonia sp.]|uniref:D-galactarate dehydratase n=1 Tax=Yoonia sp. TaxID=2212373 RepID=UPI00397642D5
MRMILILPALVLSGCASPSLQGFFGAEPAAAMPAPTLDPTPPPKPPVTAVTAAQFDTTSDADRAAAVAATEPAVARALGTTIASLGSPAEPGIWLKTPLVTKLTAGRVTHQGRT